MDRYEYKLQAMRDEELTLRWLGGLYFCLIAMMIAFAGCAGAKRFLRPIDDAATIICKLYASESVEPGGPSPAELAGITASDFCAIKENIQPFIDEVLAAKQAAGQRLSRGTAE